MKKNCYQFRLFLLCFTFLLSGSLLVLPTGCNTATEHTGRLQNAQCAVDYSCSENWIILPENGAEKLCEADLFYAYPTIVSHAAHPYMDWSDPAIQQKARIFATQQTGIFAEITRVFAPYYRQGEFQRIAKDITKPVEEQFYLQRGIADLQDAFRYYLKHHNQGRPFILFGHSQGAMALLEVIKREFADETLGNRLVAAYLIGYPSMPCSFPDYPYIHLATGEYDTNVIISYNAVAPGAENSVFTTPGSYCINPLNWRTDAEFAPAELNLGACFFDRNGKLISEIPTFCSARIHPETGALVVEPTVEGKYDTNLLGKGIYHMYDLNFFYRNLKENADKRIRAFFK